MTLVLATGEAAGQANIRAFDPPDRQSKVTGLITKMISDPGGVDQVAALLNREVQAELKLTDEQKVQASRLIPEAVRAFAVLRQTPYPPAGSPEALLAAGYRFREETGKAVARVLTPQQLARFDQILLRIEGPVAVARPEIARKLNLSRDQAAQVQGVVLDLIVAAHRLWSHGPGVPVIDPDDPGAASRAIAKQFRETAGARIALILNARQKAAFNALLGPPIDLSKIDRDLDAPAPEVLPAAKAGPRPRRGPARAKGPAAKGEGVGNPSGTTGAKAP
jgi:hypothetical protein